MNLEMSTYRCINFDFCEMEDADDHIRVWEDADPEDCDCPSGKKCSYCGSNAAVKGVRIARYVGIASYSINRAYGGPEEGGWWYNTYDILPETLRCFDTKTQEGQAEAEAYWQKLWADNKASSDKFRETVISHLEAIPPIHLPKQRPYYR